MPKSVAVAVVRYDPPEVFVAENQEVLNWVIALKLIARTPGSEIDPAVRERLRDALRNEQWGDAVEIWMQQRAAVDVYPSFTYYAEADVQLAAHELEFTPLFQD